MSSVKIGHIAVLTPVRCIEAELAEQPHQPSKLCLDNFLMLVQQNLSIEATKIQNCQNEPELPFGDANEKANVFISSTKPKLSKLTKGILGGLVNLNSLALSALFTFHPRVATGIPRGK